MALAGAGAGAGAEAEEEAEAEVEAREAAALGGRVEAVEDGRAVAASGPGLGCWGGEPNA